jgi:hypothetical protein
MKPAERQSFRFIADIFVACQQMGGINVLAGFLMWVATPEEAAQKNLFLDCERARGQAGAAGALRPLCYPKGPPGEQL